MGLSSNQHFKKLPETLEPVYVYNPCGYLPNNRLKHHQQQRNCSPRFTPLYKGKKLTIK